jgi:hypothetical protein
MSVLDLHRFREAGVTITFTGIGFPAGSWRLAKQLKLSIANSPSMRQTALDGATQLPIVLPRNDGRVYRMNPGGDRWACEMCRLTGDRFFLQDHWCSRSVKKKRL